jgi:hypothetical protein
VIAGNHGPSVNRPQMAACVPLGPRWDEAANLWKEEVAILKEASVRNRKTYAV